MTRHIKVEAQKALAVQMFDAVSEGDAALVRALLAQGVDADAWGLLDDEYDQPLQRATRLHDLNRLDIIRLLVDAGADLDFQGATIARLCTWPCNSIMVMIGKWRDYFFGPARPPCWFTKTV